MKPKHALCIVVDGLRASALGTYGNTVSPTPAIDALAAESTVCDWMWCDSPRLADFYRAVWSGGHAAWPAQGAAAVPLPVQLRDAGAGVTLLTDDPQCESFLPVAAVDSAILVEGPAADSSAATVEETASYRLIAAVAAEIEAAGGDASQAARNRLWWVHAKGLAGPWDAPRALRAALLDEEDETPLPEFVLPPQEVATDDPDELHGYRVAYAAQVGVLDECLGGLLAATESLLGEAELLIVLVGARGFALGEHGRVGTAVDALYGERLHVPCLVRRAGTAGPQPRRAALLQPNWLHDLLGEWFASESGSPATAARPAVEGEPAVVAVGAGGEYAIRTPRWLLRAAPRPAESAESLSAVELFLKPDDRWEANEIAALCPEVVAELTARAVQFGLTEESAATH
ncbi:MAG: hypothetical protein KF688_03740 [Pirellulales bacterium]|nr:hypothetical protein [Pirellulales bacterium]